MHGQHVTHSKRAHVLCNQPGTTNIMARGTWQKHFEAERQNRERVCLDPCSRTDRKRTLMVTSRVACSEGLQRSLGADKIGPGQQPMYRTMWADVTLSSSSQGATVSNRKSRTWSVTSFECAYQTGVVSHSGGGGGGTFSPGTLVSFPIIHSPNCSTIIIKQQTPWPLVRKRTIPTDRPPLVAEI
jgi:hypothetical protein